MSAALLPGVILDYSVRALCRRPYPGHPRGCPNVGYRVSCPPCAPIWENVLELSPVWVIWIVFDFGGHVARMRRLHPDWSQRQLECCLYWQGAARKALRAEISAFLAEHQGLVVTTCPEGMGVDVTATMKDCGVVLEWPPQQWAVQVAMAARPLPAAHGEPATRLESQG